MEPIIDLHNDWQALDEEILRSTISSSKKVQVEVRLPSLGYASSYLDICDELREASFVLESLSDKFKCSEVRRISETMNNRFSISISEFSPDALCDELLNLQWAIKSSADCGLGSSPTDVMREAIEDFEESIHSRILAHPEIIDDYLANKVGGAYYEAPTELAYHCKNHPERAFGFWKSPYYYGQQVTPLNSLSSSIIPKSIDLQKALERLGMNQELELLGAELITDGRTARFLTEGATLATPAINLYRAISCLSLLDLQNESYDQQNVIGQSVSDFKDLAFIETGDYWIVIHDVSDEPTHSYAKKLSQITSNIESGILIDDTFEIDWSLVNDEHFEEICYDIIYRTPTFDRSTIRKMGNSRSRDGGRDIVVYTKESPGAPARMFIFQCKCLSPKRSLTTTNLGAISDVIDQYGAEGYGVMTTGIIDPTVYDRLEAIGKRRGISIRTFSRMEVERFLARRPELLEKYKRRIQLPPAHHN